MSDFSAINTALTGLLAQQQALDTTAHNVSNANTPGYTRETVDLQAMGGSIDPGWWSGSSSGGQGVHIGGIERLGDLFGEARSQADQAATSNLTQSQQILSEIQSGFAEPGPNGLSAALSNFWSSWDNVANNPTDLSARNALVGAAQTVSQTFNQSVAGIQSVWESSLSQVQSQVQQLNTIAGNVAQLNDKIRVSQASGASPNDLIDQRTQLLGQLAQIGGVTAHTNADGTVDAFIGGTALVRGDVVDGLTVAQSASGVSVQWTTPPGQASVTSGQLNGLLTSMNVTIPSYLNNLTGVANTLAQEVNNQQASGYTLATPPASGQPGPPMLTLTSAPGPTSSAEPTYPQLAVAAGFTPDQVAAAGSATTPGDGSNAQLAAELGASTTGADAGYRSFIAGLGTDVQRTGSQLSTAQAVASQNSAALQGQEGVNTDEEMAHMVAFQNAYSAAARVLTTIDSTLDTLINHTGLTT